MSSHPSIPAFNGCDATSRGRQPNSFSVFVEPVEPVDAGRAISLFQFERSGERELPNKLVGKHSTKILGVLSIVSTDEFSQKKSNKKSSTGIQQLVGLG
jgi:hypothetical protein